MKLYCIADEETVRGFRLAGIAGQTVRTNKQAATVLAQAAAQVDCGLIILTEAVADGIRPQVERLRWEATCPLLVEIPGPEGPLPGRKNLGRIVQEAVGLRLGQ